MNRNSTTNDYLSFSKKEKLGILCFFAIAAAIYAAPYLFFQDNSDTLLRNDPSLLAAIDTLQYRKRQIVEMAVEDDGLNHYQPLQNAKFEAGELFAFDPNEATAEDLQKLGLPGRTIKTIFNYRSKGGRFYKKEDLQKIWGLPKGFYDRVENHITISAKAYSKQPDFATLKSTKSERKQLDLNVADSSALIALPGIGSKLANRIISFRQKLGGFYSVNQLGEVYGLPDSTFQKLKPILIVSNSYEKFNLNTITKDELKAHPYFKWTLANAIVEYRNQHGPFDSIEDLKKIAVIDEATFSKISNYLTL